ncbi:hypothetical protein ACH5RR_006602 [Cinchona calisaya]|uniref:Uncharacterized protein n=1 Tax=Cinchona calisaya TaxID=153742 RepID=A0ABD3API1_9GENT
MEGGRKGGQGEARFDMARRLTSGCESDEKNFKRTRHYKGLSPDNSPENEHTASFTDLTDQTAERVHQTFDLAKKISSQEKFGKDVDHEDVENLSLKLSDHLKTLQDLNSQLQESHEQLQELENQKTVLLKKEARIQAEKLQVEDRCGELSFGIAALEKSLEQGRKYEQLITTEIHEARQENI